MYEGNTVKQSSYHESTPRPFQQLSGKSGKISIWEMDGTEQPSQKLISQKQDSNSMERKVTSKQEHSDYNDDFGEKRYMQMGQISTKNYLIYISSLIPKILSHQLPMDLS